MILAAGVRWDPLAFRAGENCAWFLEFCHKILDRSSDPVSDDLKRFFLGFAIRFGLRRAMVNSVDCDGRKETFEVERLFDSLIGDERLHLRISRFRANGKVSG